MQHIRQPGRPPSSTVRSAEARLVLVDPALPGQVADTAPGARAQAPCGLPATKPSRPRAGSSGSPPTRCLRRVRLDHAHRQLAAADPEHESVTAVSYQWGFASSSRFAAYYRTVYGVSPSSTLHSR